MIVHLERQKSGMQAVVLENWKARPCVWFDILQECVSVSVLFEDRRRALWFNSSTPRDEVENLT